MLQASQVLMAKYQQLEAELAALQEEAKELRRRNKEAEKEVQEAQWRHAEDESSLKSAVADAQVGRPRGQAGSPHDASAN